LPVIAADWSGYRDTVVDGETGYLIPTVMPIFPSSFDVIRGSGAMKSIDLLAATTSMNLSCFQAALENLVTDSDKRKRLGHAGYLRARRLYDWRIVIQAYESLWQELNEAARAFSAAQHSFLDIEGYDYRDIFGHYPTALLSQEASFAITDLGLVCIENPQRTAQFLGNSDETFNLEWMQEILRTAGAITSTTLEDLMIRFRQPEDSDGLLIIAAVGRLMKYGLLQPAVFNTQKSRQMSITPQLHVE
jgi:hypothetical protein